MKLFDELKTLINSDELNKDVESFDKGNAAAGTRIRKVMQEVKQYGQQIRESVTLIKDEREIKKV